MKKTSPFGSKSGVTLIELLVVMLIVVILAISLLPVFQKYIIEAQYTAEAVPAVADLRLKTELIRYENQGGLPGMVDDDPVGDPTVASASSVITGNEFTQTWVTNTPAGAATVQFGFAGKAYDAAANLTSSNTVWADLNIQATDLIGRRIKPTDVQYQAFSGPNGYMYAWGVFGGGAESRLVGGSGFAVLEVVNRSTNGVMKVVGEWKRYIEGPTSPGLDQVQMVSGADVGFTLPTTPAGWANVGACYIGDPLTLLGDAQAGVTIALDQLRDAGWTFNID